MSALLKVVALVLALVALAPLVDRAVARRQARRAVADAEAALRAAQRERREPRALRCPAMDEALLGARSAEPELVSWGNIGGCGVGGGASSSTAGGAKWIGRGVTGGHLDLMCMSSQTMAKGGYFTAINTRFGTWLRQRWLLALNVPLLYKVRDVATLSGVDKQAAIAGFGDLSLELGRKLGITNAHLIELMVSAPTGSHDAVRQGVVLPQILQLGSGVLTATGMYEHTWDRDWGLILAGGSATFAGWENGQGDYRASSAAAYAYGGYLLGPFVPSLGLTLMGKFGHDHQSLGPARKAIDDALFYTIFNAAVEWSIDWLAILLSTSTTVSYKGFEGFTVSLGISTSVF
jgi:hypothetical protein